MEGGDLSNATVGRALFIWDDLLARLEDDRLYPLHMATRRYERAFRCWKPTSYEPNLFQYAQRTPLTVEVVTHQEHFTGYIRDRYDHLGWRVRDVWYEEESVLVKMLATGAMPDVREVFYASPNQIDLKYGPLGQTVRSVFV